MEPDIEEQAKNRCGSHAVELPLSNADAAEVGRRNMEKGYQIAFIDLSFEIAYKNEEIRDLEREVEDLKNQLFYNSRD